LERLRQRLSYANVMSTLAAFLVVAGGAAYAASELTRNEVKSKHIAPNAVKGVDAAEATFGQVPSAKNAEAAETAATASGVAPDAVGAPGIQNTTRSINFPLGAFVNVGGSEAIDFTSADDLAPDFISLAGPGLVIEWDDGPGADVGDVDFVGANFAVPTDYASGGSFALRVSKSGHAGLTEQLVCNTQTSPDPFAIAATTSAANTLYVLTPGGTYSPGASIAFFCGVSDVTFTGNYDDFVRLHSIEFRYTATQ
jgi:hypothetical protein